MKVLECWRNRLFPDHFVSAAAKKIEITNSNFCKVLLQRLASDLSSDFPDTMEQSILPLSLSHSLSLSLSLLFFRYLFLSLSHAHTCTHLHSAFSFLPLLVMPPLSCPDVFSSTLCIESHQQPFTPLSFVTLFVSLSFLTFYLFLSLYVFLFLFSSLYSLSLVFAACLNYPFFTFVSVCLPCCISPSLFPIISQSLSLFLLSRRDD